MEPAPAVVLRGEGEPHLHLPQRRARRTGVGRVLVRIALVVVIAGCGLLTVLLVASDTGITGFGVGAVLALLPVVPVVAAILWLDRYEHEPPGQLVFAFAWGAFVATFVSLVLNTSSMELIRAAGGNPDSAAVLVAPFVEETTKGLAVLLLWLFRRREFDGVVDGIVYAALAGVGFAFVENVLYLGRSFSEDGGGVTAVTFVVRCLFSPFAHPLFTAAIGVGIGVAASRRNPVLRVFAPLLGWCVAVALHALWNLTASQGLQGFIGTYVALQVPIFVVAVAVAVVARTREGRVLRRHLAGYAQAGWITPAEARMLSSLSERSRARDWAGRALGPQAKGAMRDFQELASEVSFLRDRMERGTAPAGAPEAELAGLQSMWRLRRAFVPAGA
ncbi:PrsW family intramembrane metalloprotease [Streptomyces sp. NP160]|uniref:PrsW family intramembrane metalloprotease n=1 Tax=Streptomyces sp. NP160 TaxID=2586637 RepID=UPI001118E50E|nr:PrsW family intramembrane metalloprotease [Streptomyces sp. NP160]TNM59939.1 PrsW family intramembrane metalloprotease [Streptomyces sp. NP160]